MKKIYIIMILGESMRRTSRILINHGGIEGMEKHGDC